MVGLTGRSPADSTCPLVTADVFMATITSKWRARPSQTVRQRHRRQARLPGADLLAAPQTASRAKDELGNYAVPPLRKPADADSSRFARSCRIRRGLRQHGAGLSGGDLRFG